MLTSRLATAVLVLTVACGQAEVPTPPPNPWFPQPVPPPPLTEPEPLGPARTLTAGRIEQLQALAKARQRWQTMRQVSYRLIVSRLCFCDVGTPFESTVRGGAVITAAGGVRSGGRAVEPALRTVEALFAEAERLIRSNVDHVSVCFDPQLGYPSVIDVDWHEGSIDDEWTWRATLTDIRLGDGRLAPDDGTGARHR